MAEFLRRHSVLLTTIVLVISSLQLMSASIQNPELPRLGGKIIDYVLAPIEDLNHNFTNSAEDLWSGYVYLVGVKEQNAELNSRIKTLEAQNSRLIELGSENQRLRQLVSFQESTGLGGVTAAIIGRDPSNWIRTVTINKGTADGIRPGLPVVDGYAVVGQTTVVNRHSARVLLLTDSRSAVDAIVQSSRGPGVVEGTGSKDLHLNYVIREHQVDVGDRVIASGFDGVYPKGVLIGVVTGVSAKDEGMFYEVVLKPSVDVERLENVLVVLPEVSDNKVMLEPSKIPEIAGAGAGNPE